jgi:hypothetical protein
LKLDPKQVRGCLDEIVSELLNAADNVECQRFNKDTQLTATLSQLMRMASLIRPLLLLMRLPSDDPYLRSGPRFARQKSRGNCGFWVVAPFDFHRAIASLPNALDCNHAEAQTADRKAIPSGYGHLRTLQCSVQVRRIFPRCRYSGTVRLPQVQACRQ